MEIPDNLKYSKEHEWVRVEGNHAIVGITDFAQEQLGDIVHLELPGDGVSFEREDTVGVVESVKSVSDIYAPMAGGIIEVNSVLLEDPAVINQDCYGEGWLYKCSLKNKSELNELMDAKQYKTYLEEEGYE